jgi:large subunit ribosomal protein L32e
MVKFLRRTWNRYSKLGKGRKKKQVWRSPKGRDNKMREKRRGYPVVVSIGYKKGEELRNVAENKKIVLIKNLKELERIKENEIAIIGNIGKKKKIELVKKAKEMKIKIHNLNEKTFLKKIEIEEKKKEKIKKEKLEAKKTKTEIKKEAKEKKKEEENPKENKIKEKKK